MNYLIDIQPKRPTDYSIGALDETPINPSGNWKDCLPIKEYQNRGLETVACVSFSALNCLEILHKRLYGVEMNWSDRFTAKMSNTTHRGNWLTTVADSIRHDGLILEKDYPSIWTSWDNYYQEVPQELKNKGKEFLKQYKINYEWIIPTNPDTLIYALKIAPIQVVVHAWSNKVNGIYQRTEKPLNHAVVLINSVYGKYWEIFDTYDGIIKKLAWDYNINHGFKYSLTKNNMRFIKEKSKSAVYLIKGQELYPINDEKDYLNLELDWSVVQEVENLDGYTISDKKLYTFIR